MTAAMINAELKRAAGTPFSIGGADERKLAKIPSGVIKLSDFYGKSNGGVGEGTGAAWRASQNSSYGTGGTGTAMAKLTFLTNGQTRAQSGTGTVDVMPWYYPLETGIGSGYFMRLSSVTYTTEKALNQPVTSNYGTPSGNYYSHVYSMSAAPNVWVRLSNAFEIYTSITFSAGSGNVLRETNMTLQGMVQFSEDGSTVIFSKSFTVQTGTYGE